MIVLIFDLVVPLFNMKVKLDCKLKLKDPTEHVYIDGSSPGTIAEEINIIELPDSMSDSEIKAFFDKFRADLMQRYSNDIFSFFKVDLTQLKE